MRRLSGQFFKGLEGKKYAFNINRLPKMDTELHIEETVGDINEMVKGTDETVTTILQVHIVNPEKIV